MRNARPHSRAFSFGAGAAASRRVQSVRCGRRLTVRDDPSGRGWSMRSGIRSRRALALFASAAVLVAGCTSAYQRQSTNLSRPVARSAPLPMAAQLGLPVAATLAAVPADNPQTVDKVALG